VPSSTKPGRPSIKRWCRSACRDKHPFRPPRRIAKKTPKANHPWAECYSSPQAPHRARWSEGVSWDRVQFHRSLECASRGAPLNSAPVGAIVKRLRPPRIDRTQPAAQRAGRSTERRCPPPRKHFGVLRPRPPPHPNRIRPRWRPGAQQSRSFLRWWKAKFCLFPNAAYARPQGNPV